jgi:hypothetical protein
VRELVAALLIGAVVGAVATFGLMLQATPGTDAAAAAALAPVVRTPSTTAGQQYVDWYTRAPAAPQDSTSAGQQYMDWYTRPSENVPRTTAGEQYRSWYLRETNGQ